VSLEVQDYCRSLENIDVGNETGTNTSRNLYFIETS